MTHLAHHWKQLKPAEHGSWSLLLTPFLIGAGLALATGTAQQGAALALLIFAVLVLAVFLVRQPAGVLIRVWRGRARRTGAMLAVWWTVALFTVATLCAVGLLILKRDVILLLALPGGLALTLALLVSALHGPRGLALEIIGALGLALAAPGAYGAISGLLDAGALAAWTISAAYSVVTILYVRLRVDTRHERVSSGGRRLVAISHLLVFVGTVIAGSTDALPWLAALPFGLLLVRALWAAWRIPRLGDVRRFGFLEMGVALAFVGLIVLAYGVSS